MHGAIVSRAYAVAAWMIVAVGAFHMAFTWRLATATPFTRVWFFGSGIAMVQVGAFNLLHRRYGHEASGLAWVTRLGNLCMLAFAAVGGAVTGATAAEAALILGVLGTLQVFSFLPAALMRGERRAGD